MQIIFLMRNNLNKIKFVYQFNELLICMCFNKYIQLNELTKYSMLNE